MPAEPVYDRDAAYRAPAPPAPTHRHMSAVPATTTSTRPSVGGLVARIVLTVLGAAGLVYGAFLNFVAGINGTHLDDRAFTSTNFIDTGTFVRTVGFVMIVLGLVALLGLAPRSGWLTRVAGALGIIGFALVAIEAVRAPGGQALQTGAWLCLAGAALALVGGFFGTRRVVTREPAQTTVVE
jgi:hypothetical protein